MQRIKSLLNRNLSKQIVIYLLFSFVVWIIHLCFVSSTASIHFLLNHTLGIIEEWIFDKGWELIILTKLFSLGIAFKFLDVQDKRRSSLRSIAGTGLLSPPKELFILVIFLTSSIFIVGKPILSDKYELNLIDLLVYFVGIFVFYMSDIFMSIFLDRTYPLSRLEKFIKIIAFSLIFYFTSKLTFRYGKNMDFLILFHFIVGIICSNYKKLNWTLSLLFLSAFTCPISLILGQDPVYGNAYSVFVLSKPLDLAVILSLIVTSIIYLFGKEMIFNEGQESGIIKSKFTKIKEFCSWKHNN